MRHAIVPLLFAALGAGCSAGADAAGPVDLEALRLQVADTERAFARSMADRDHAAFVSFLADETVFFAGDTPLRGKETVAAEWLPFYEGPEAPFSWEPDLVEVLASGTLALSTGPVRAPDGQVTGRFNSIWRREPSGDWKIVFDRGSPVCDCGGVPQ